MIAVTLKAPRVDRTREQPAPVGASEIRPRRGASKERLLLAARSVAVAGTLILSLLAPIHRLLDEAMRQVSERAATHAENTAATATPFGVCADLCTKAGVCRHVVVPEGWHRGHPVSDQQVLAAPACR